MTNKDQLIQEMASDMNYATVKHDLWPDDAKEIARVLVILGYCKIPEGSVMLSQDEYDRYKRCEEVCNEFLDGQQHITLETLLQFSNDIKQVKKEIARYWYRLAFNLFEALWAQGILTNEKLFGCIDILIKEAKKFGVEVKIEGL